MRLKVGVSSVCTREGWGFCACVLCHVCFEAALCTTLFVCDPNCQRQILAPKAVSVTLWLFGRTNEPKQVLSLLMENKIFQQEWNHRQNIKPSSLHQQELIVRESPEARASRRSSHNTLVQRQNQYLGSGPKKIRWNFSLSTENVQTYTNGFVRRATGRREIRGYIGVER